MIKIKNLSSQTELTLPVNPTTSFADTIFLKSLIYNTTFPISCTLLNHYSNFIKLLVDTTDLKTGEYKYTYADTTGIIVVGDYYQDAEKSLSTIDVVEVENQERKTFKRK